MKASLIITVDSFSCCDDICNICASNLKNQKCEVEKMGIVAARLSCSTDYIFESLILHVEDRPLVTVRIVDMAGI